MSQIKRFVLLAGAAISLGGVSAAQGQEQGTDEVRAIVAEMLADAQNRSSLLAGGSGGHDGNFYLADDAGNFRLNVSGQIQFRYVIGFRDEDNADDDFTTGFQTRRTKLEFSGHVVNPNWTYKVVGAFDRDGGSFNLEDAYVGYNFGNGWRVKMGQFKAPFLREELVSSKYQLAAERSVVNELFNQDYSQGLELRYEAADWRVMAAFTDGFGTRNTDYPNGAGGADYALTGRGEWKFAGDWKDFEDFTSKAGQNFSGLLGGAIHWQQSANTNDIADVDLDYLTYTADVSFEGDSWNAYGAFVGSHAEARAAGTDNDFDDFGVLLQGGYRFAANTELFARWDGVFLDEDRNAADDNVNFLTVGLNQYYAGHAAKATVDFIYSFNEATSLTGFNPSSSGLGVQGFQNGGYPSTGLGLLGDMEEGEIAVRFQFQLLF
jgi:hypothetical protein